MNWKMKRISFEGIFDGVRRRVNNYEGKLVPDDQVASGGKRSIGSVGNGFDNVQCGSKSRKMLCQILNIEQGGGGVPEEIGTCLVDNRCSANQFAV